MINLVYKVRIRRQENQKSDSYWQEFEFGGSENSSIAAVLNELNSRSPLTEHVGIRLLLLDGNAVVWYVNAERVPC